MSIVGQTFILSVSTSNVGASDSIRHDVAHRQGPTTDFDGLKHMDPTFRHNIACSTDRVTEHLHASNQAWVRDRRLNMHT